MINARAVGFDYNSADFNAFRLASGAYVHLFLTTKSPAFTGRLGHRAATRQL